MIELINTLTILDYSIFHIFNVILHNSAFDLAMPIITDIKLWIPVILIGFVIMIKRQKTRGLIYVLYILLTVGICDAVNHNITKELVNRERPCNQNIEARVLVSKPGGMSFPSSHALNSFYLAFMFAQFFQKRRWYFYSIAGLIAYTRVYCGVHFPLDILVGSIFGIAFGYLFYLLYQQLDKKIYKNAEISNN